MVQKPYHFESCYSFQNFSKLVEKSKNSYCITKCLLTPALNQINNILLKSRVYSPAAEKFTLRLTTCSKQNTNMSALESYAKGLVRSMPLNRGCRIFQFEWFDDVWKLFLVLTFSSFINYRPVIVLEPISTALIFCCNKNF